MLFVSFPVSSVARMHYANSEIFFIWCARLMLFSLKCVHSPYGTGISRHLYLLTTLAQSHYTNSCAICMHMVTVVIEINPK